MRLAQFMSCVLDAFEATLVKYGVRTVRRKAVECHKELFLRYDVTTLIGISGDARGNIAYSFSNDTAKNIASSMLMGTNVTHLDEIAQSAITELTNMMTGNATIKMSEHQAIVDITPPSLLIGKNTRFYLNFPNIYSVTLDTTVGEIEINFGVHFSRREEAIQT
jgi:chemotaxis protein CheX